MKLQRPPPLKMPIHRFSRRGLLGLVRQDLRFGKTSLAPTAWKSGRGMFDRAFAGLPFAGKDKSIFLRVALAGVGSAFGFELWRRRSTVACSEDVEPPTLYSSPEELKKAPAPGRGDKLPMFTRSAMI